MKFGRDGGLTIRQFAFARRAGRFLPHAHVAFCMPSSCSGQIGCRLLLTAAVSNAVWPLFGLMSPLLSAARMKVEGKKEGAPRGPFLLELLLPRAFRFRAAVFCIAMCSVAASIAVVVRLLGQGCLFSGHTPNGARFRCVLFAFCRHRSHLLSPTGCVPKSPIIAVLLNMRGTKRCAERDKVRNEARC